MIIYHQSVLLATFNRDLFLLTEQYLGLKNPLHRKKVQLALQAMGGARGRTGPGSWTTTGSLDGWMMWGCPQYKDSFVEAKVDGRMLHYMTVVS